MTSIPLVQKDDQELTIGAMKTRKRMHDMKYLHYHDSYELYYMLEGKRSFFISHKTYEVAKGDLICINRNQIHRTLEREEAYHKRVMIEFQEGVLTRMGCNHEILLPTIFHEECHIMRLDYRMQLQVESLLHKIMEEEENKEKGYKTYLRLLLMELLMTIQRIAEENKPSYQEQTNSLHHKVSDIVTYINKHYHERLSLAGVAKIFYISSNYLSRIFRESTGFTYIEYLNHVRIKSAQKLLRETSINITQVAHEVGYDNITHFGRVFKGMTGYTAMQYRKQF